MPSQTLKKALKEIEKLEKDLDAEIYHESTGHFEEGDRSCGSFHWEDVWVVDNAAYTEPDVGKREATKQKLQKICDSSEWYSARYIAHGRLSWKLRNVFWNDPDGSKIENFISELKDLLNTNDKRIYKRARQDLKYFFRNLCNDNQRQKVGKILGYSDLRIWTYEHPITTTTTGIASAVAASGLGYMIYQYLTR